MSVHSVMSTLKRIHFQREEEDILQEIVDMYENDWKKNGNDIERTYNDKIEEYNIQHAKDFPSRTKKILKQHWDQVSNPSINKLAWNEDEIKNLKSLYQRYPKNWDEIRKRLGTNRCKFWIMNECVRQNLLTKKELKDEIDNDKQTKIKESKTQLIEAVRQLISALEVFISYLD